MRTPGTSEHSAHAIDHRRLAVRRGIAFIIAIASDPDTFRHHSTDLLWCFASLAAASPKSELRRTCRQAGQERARTWCAANSVVSASASASMIADLVYGAVSADLLGVPHETMKRALRARAQRFTPRDYLHFDPTCEPIPDDVPRPCTRCGTRSARGSAACVRCQAALRMLDRYNIFFNAMVTTYFGDVSGITLGAHLADVLRWLPGLRPYRWSGSKPDRAFYRIAYTITHIVYVLNDYGRHHVPPDWLPQEFDFLQRYLQVLIEGDDPEALGEFIECLRAFGLTDTDSWIRRGIDFLLASQHSDGSWGDSNEPNIYTRYHTTWTCINALMDVDWKPPKAHRLAI